jgi:hypothetical protein
MSATRVYKLTTTRITKILTDAGFTQSRTYGQRIKQTSPGFIVRAGLDVFTIEVTHSTHSDRFIESDRDEIEAMLSRYAEPIDGAGYVTKVRQSPYGSRLVVSPPPKESGR